MIVFEKRLSSYSSLLGFVFANPSRDVDVLGNILSYNCLSIGQSICFAFLLKIREYILDPPLLLVKGLASPLFFDC